MKKLFICTAILCGGLYLVNFYNQVVTISNCESDIIQVRRFELKTLSKDTVLFNGVRCLIIK